MKNLQSDLFASWSRNKNPKVREPKIAIYTAFTNLDGTLRGWPSPEVASAFIGQAAHRAQKLFDRVILHTDSDGKKLLRNAVFDEVIVSLDGFDISPEIRSAVKIDTYSRQTEPFIHMDWDFILWRKPLPKSLKSVFAQSKGEVASNSTISLLWRSLPYKPNFVSKILEDESVLELPCTSILGGSDVGFLKWYSSLALDILRHPKNGFIKSFAEGAFATDVCVAFEQWLLAACARHAGVKINYFSGQPTHLINASNIHEADFLGFSHLAGPEKHSAEWAAKIQTLNVEASLPYNPSDSIVHVGTHGEGSPINLQEIPLKVLLSVKSEKSRRAHARKQFRQLDLDVEWREPIDVASIVWRPELDPYKGKPRYASQALSLIALLEDAERRKAKSLIHFEDDVFFHPQFSELLAQVKFPEDWKFIYLGGRNCGIKEHVSRGLSRSTFVADLHAVIIHSDIFQEVRRVLSDPAIQSGWADFRIGTLHSRFPAYLCRPNLAWQIPFEENFSGGIVYCNYEEDGSVKVGQGD